VQLKEDAINGHIKVNVNKVNLGLLLENFGIIAGQDAATDEVVLIIKFQGTNSTELYQRAEIDLQLRKGSWNLSSSKVDHTKELSFSHLSLSTSWNMPIVLHLDGMFVDESIKLDFKVNELAEFFDEVKTLDVDLKVNVAGSHITAKGTINLPIKTNQFQLDISLKGQELEKLNKLIDSELPPFNNYNLTGKLLANERGYILKADDAVIGDTQFRTVIVVDTSSFKPFWSINLHSRQLQIKDFETDQWNVEKLDSANIKASMKQTSGISKEESGRRFKQIVQDPKMRFDLNLNVEKVLAGEYVIGKSRLGLKLRDNTLILEDAEFDVPGGKIKSTASFKVKNKQVTGTLKLDIDKFEYGAVARYFMPGSPQRGVVRARIDLKLGGKNFARLFDHASGKLDVALWPRNTQSNIFDVWATNLFLVILPEINKKESRLNCLVALMDLDDGIMTEDFFGIDTTKVWMHGNINVNFAEEYVRLSLYPRSKQARLFAWQAPIRAEGNFTDIGLTTNPVDLTVAYYSFITSPLHVPARWVFGDEVPGDASAICEQLYDREYMEKLKEKRKKSEQKEIDEWLDSD